jgi:Asp-tRNA(Asn)/Glu-tRNA(Gln) amidotransferase A subunit family amidase
MADSGIWRLSATETAAMVAAGQFSAADAVEACLERIGEVGSVINFLYSV